MSKHHKGWRGCCMLCARWFRGEGRNKRLRFSELRRVGARRRLSNLDER